MDNKATTVAANMTKIRIFLAIVVLSCSLLSGINAESSGINGINAESSGINPLPSMPYNATQESRLTTQLDARTTYLQKRFFGNRIGVTLR